MPRAASFVCPTCDKELANQGSLRRHMTLHNEDESYHRCPYPGCPFRTRQETNFTRHYRLHTGEKPLKCSYANCDVEFSDPSLLTKHKKKVHGYIPNRRAKRSKSVAVSVVPAVVPKVEPIIVEVPKTPSVSDSSSTGVKVEVKVEAPQVLAPSTNLQSASQVQQQTEATLHHEIPNSDAPGSSSLVQQQMVPDISLYPIDTFSGPLSSPFDPTNTDYDKVEAANGYNLPYDSFSSNATGKLASTDRYDFMPQNWPQTYDYFATAGMMPVAPAPVPSSSSSEFTPSVSLAGFNSFSSGSQNIDPFSLHYQNLFNF